MPSLLTQTPFCGAHPRTVCKYLNSRTHSALSLLSPPVPPLPRTRRSTQSSTLDLDRSSMFPPTVEIPSLPKLSWVRRRLSAPLSSTRVLPVMSGCRPTRVSSTPPTTARASPPSPGLLRHAASSPQFLRTLIFRSIGMVDLARRTRQIRRLSRRLCRRRYQWCRLLQVRRRRRELGEDQRRHSRLRLGLCKRRRW